MKYLTLALIAVLFCCCENDNKYIKQYPFFKNIEIHKEDGTVTLNNFKSNKEGLEYLIDTVGHLIEARQWKNNYLNGYLVRYASNGNIMMLGHMINDTLNGSYFSFDTIHGSIKQYREYLNINGRNAVNQIIYFKNGKIDFERSTFIKIKKISSSEYRIFLFSNYVNPYLKAYWNESNNCEYEFNKNEYDSITESITNKYIKLNINGSKSCITGYLINYRLPTSEELGAGAKKDDLIGPMIYFKSETSLANSR